MICLHRQRHTIELGSLRGVVEHTDVYRENRWRCVRPFQVLTLRILAARSVAVPHLYASPTINIEHTSAMRVETQIITYTDIIAHNSFGIEFLLDECEHLPTILIQ
jgi:hypothetical protein